MKMIGKRWCKLLHAMDNIGMNTIALEDLVTIVCTEFVKQNRHLLQQFAVMEINKHKVAVNKMIPYLKMNAKARRKISERLLESLES